MRKHYVVPLEKKARAKCRQWQLRVDSGRKTPKGATSWKTRKVTGVTWSQAVEECERWAADLDEGRAVIPDRKWTFAQYREHWIECCGLEGVPSGTLRTRANSVAAMGMHLDGLDLADIDAPALNAAIAALRRGDSPSGRALSGTYLGSVLSNTRMMLEHARKAGAIASNPADDASRPACDTLERRPVTPSEGAALRSALDPADWRHRAVLLLAETGMRQCEVLPPGVLAQCHPDW